MSKEIKNPNLLNDIDLEMKSNYNTNSDIISGDDTQNKESKNVKSEAYSEFKSSKGDLTNNDDNYNKSAIKETNHITKNKMNIFGDLTDIIKDKIKKNNIKNKKNVRLLSSSSVLSTEEKRKRIKNFPYIQNSKTNHSQILSSSKSKKGNPIIFNKKNNKKRKINPALFVNKKNNIRTKNKTNNDNLKTESKKINFKDVLLRFEEEKKNAQRKFEKKKKELKDRENLIYTGRPQLYKTSRNKYNKFSKDFLIRQKELNEYSNLKKQKLIDETNKKREEEYRRIMSNSIINKKMSKMRRNKSGDEWVERLYKKDSQNRKLKKDCMEKICLPTFKPNLPKLKYHKSVDKISRINSVLEKYKEKQNPQLLIDYLNKNNNKFDDSKELFRQKIFAKFSNKKKKINNSMDLKVEDSSDENN